MHMNVSLMQIYICSTSHRKMDEGSSTVVSTKPTGKEINTDTETASLATLTESDIGKSIYVKAYRKWTVTNKNGKPIMFCSMLLDRQVPSLILL